VSRGITTDYGDYIVTDYDEEYIEAWLSERMNWWSLSDVCLCKEIELTDDIIDKLRRGKVLVFIAGNNEEYQGVIVKFKVKEDEVSIHNKNYLGLNDGQYDRHCEFMDMKMSEWPSDLYEYVKETTQKLGSCGDVIAVAVAEWLKTEDVELVARLKASGLLKCGGIE